MKLPNTPNTAYHRGMYIALCLLLTVSFCVFDLPLRQPQTANAAADSRNATQLSTTNDAQPIDVIVLLDDSGSMATCWPWPTDGNIITTNCQWPSVNPPSDPDELRYSAARLMVALADDEDRMAVVRFDTAGAGVGALGTLQTVGAPENRRQLAATLSAPNDYLRRGYTRIDLGLDLAIDQLLGSQQPNRSQYIVLLTDGEPTQPDSTVRQKARISDQLATLRNANVLVFPVILCNATAGCEGDFLREEFAEYGVREAATAQDLLRVFLELFAEIKPDRSVITRRNGAGAIQLTTRAAQAVRQLAVVTPRGGLTSLRRDGEPFLAQRVLEDPNIDLNMIETRFVESGVLPTGRWTAETIDLSGFAVVQANSYPLLVNPPPSIAGSPASVRYYPAGKPPLLIARGVGVSADEPLVVNGQTTMQPLGTGDVRAHQLTDEPRAITLQLGEEKSPLQLIRTYRMEGRRNLPRAEVFSPTVNQQGITDDGRLSLQAGFGPGASVKNITATALVTDESADEMGGGRLVHQATLTCDGRTCVDTAFSPEDGRSYAILYIVEGEADGIRYSDWAKASVGLKPAVYLRGLPDQIDLAQMPRDGWPIQLASGTTEEIGMLSAEIVLRRVETNSEGETVAEEMPAVVLDFREDVPEDGALDTTLFIDGLDTLRPGNYVGEITLRANSPAGRAMDIELRPAPEIPVALTVARPTARLDSNVLNFGEVLFDTSPNFRLNEEIQIPVAYEGDPFKLTATVQDSGCNGLNVETGDPIVQEGSALLPVRLTSRTSVRANTCAGVITLVGPNRVDYDVFPSQLEWQVRVNDVEWSLVSGELSLGDLRNPGERAEETLLIRFNGKTPFIVQMDKLAASASLGDGTTQAITPVEIEMPAVEVDGPANDADLYEVPVTFIARQPIVNDPVQGAFYTGEIQLSILGLPGAAKTVDISFRSPTILQRYVAPIVVPVYSLPWALCTWPLSLLLLLVLIARFRGRGFDEEEIEEAAIATAHSSQAMPEGLGSGGDFMPQPTSGLAAADDTVWGNAAWGGSGDSEWGSAWGQAAGESQPSQPETSTNNADGDTWQSSW